MRLRDFTCDAGKKLARLMIVAFGLVAVMWIVAWAVRPDLSAEATWHYSDIEIAQAKEAREANFDAKNPPTVHRHIIVKPAGQSPILAKLVDEGKLPPLKERMPEEPIVMEGPDGIGNYGGSWLRTSKSPSDVSFIKNQISGARLIRWSPTGYPLENHLAKSVESSENGRVWTVTLRKGVKWSDGVPYDADDIMFWWNDIANNTNLNALPPVWMFCGGKLGEVEKVDQYTVRFTFAIPYPLFREALAAPAAYALCDNPRHYLKQYHPDPNIGDADVIKRDMDLYRLPSPNALYNFVTEFQNPEHPHLWPWIYRNFRASSPQVFYRNPYYYVVDTKGNQLPYVDRVQFDVMDSKTVALVIANGGVTMQADNVMFRDYTEMTSRSKQKGTHLFHWYNATRAPYIVNPNINRYVDPADPISQFKADLLGNKTFRQALSLGIDRQRIIDAEYSGVGEPSQVSPGPLSPYYSEKAAKAFTEYDPVRANAMLDSLGLTQRDYEGFRTFKDGSRMVFFVDITEFKGTGEAQFIVDDWKKIGIRIVLRLRSWQLFYLGKENRRGDFHVSGGSSEFMPQIYARYFIPYDTESLFAVGWGRWYFRGGLYLDPSSEKLKGTVPIPKDSPMYEAATLYDEALLETDPVIRKQKMVRVLDIGGENTWTIGITSSQPTMVVVKDGFKNVPAHAVFGTYFSSPSNTGVETYYFEKPQDSPGAIAETTLAMTQIIPRHGGTVDNVNPPFSAGQWIGWIIKWMFIVGGLLLLVLVIIRHPFIRRRLLIMIPTMLVISVLVFVIIQLPPGDYLTSKVMKLQESGDTVEMQAVEDLKVQFHYDEPMFKRYLRWMGVYWFIPMKDAKTGDLQWFHNSNLGLLQGDLGRSMETAQPVNDMVGDRLLLTFLISLGTILMTWSLAIPIGIYSAVKQYSIADYILTLLGFIGMCIPAFLLALVLGVLADVQGLFSPEFAAQPEWDWPKFVDLVQHMWVPIIVLGVGGTAGMIRIMRANLLDELQKPYVVTARAKGVRPLKLLFKYPVRIAINPFVSGIGALFPQLVSGGAIVAMVLSLPTIGPLMLQALISEDMYLCGSMLVLLSMLGVIGTLVSDLLLLWLDPRIRLEGGSR